MRLTKGCVFPIKKFRGDAEIREFECEICGFGPIFELFEFRCGVPHRPDQLDEDGEYLYHVCLDCFMDGADSFPERLRKHAETLEEHARELRKLAADAKWTAGGKGNIIFIRR
jgi:hypothetical protein